MIERIYILESVDPVIFYGVNNSNMQLIKTLFPKLRIVARGNVMKVIGDEDWLLGIPSLTSRCLNIKSCEKAEKHATTTETISKINLFIVVDIGISLTYCK